MSAPKPTPQPNRHQRRALLRAVQRAHKSTTTTMTSTTLSGAKVRQTATTHSTHTAPRTCDQLGVCNSRTPACKANLCQQGRTACPVPQACEVAERTQPAAPITPRTSVASLDWGHPWAPLEEPPASAKDIASALAVVLCAIGAAVVIVISLAP